jgi:hypothetical protein
MKKLVVSMIAVLAAGAAFAATNEVYSRNAVGYEAIQLSTNQLEMVRYDFMYLGSGLCTVSNLIGDQLPAGSSVYLWDGVSQKYVVENKIRSGWTPNTNIINYAQAFFLKAGVTNTTVYLMGEVPDQYTSPVKTSAVYGVSGGALGQYAYAYPVAIPFTNTLFYSNSVAGDSLNIWSKTGNNYQVWNKIRSGWQPSIPSVVIQPGQGFFYRTTNTAPWVMVKPYTWP